MTPTVLVTGGTGFVGAHTVARALAAGHAVRTTVRTPAREQEVRDMIAVAGVDDGHALTFAHADLTADDGWDAAVAGVDAVLHVASPFPAGPVADEDDVIVPARDGALRVLRAARDAGVRRVVLTSSFAAIGYGHSATDRVLDERDWTDVDGGVAPYIKSKAIAERAAWDFVAREGGALELAVVNPVGIFGPALGPALSASIQLIRALLDGTMADGMPDMRFAAVDVRDVADLHLTAMTHPDAAGERFLAAAGDTVTLADVAAALRARLGERAARVPTTVLGGGDTEGGGAHLTSAKARRVLGWTPRSTEEAVVASAESLLALGLVD